jgi:hypothetical protein
MGSLKSHQSVLQRSIHPGDNSWEFSVKNLPALEKANPNGLIKLIAVVSSTTKQSIYLRFEQAPSNRITRTESLNRLLLLSFSDFRLQLPYIEGGNGQKPATMKDSADYINKMLKTGIVLNGIRYNFYGHSNSQLKSRSCFMYAGTKDEIFAKVEAMGDFSKLKSVAKKVKRIGLLFSSAEMALTLSPDRYEDIPDVINNDYIFTDGCGLISTHFARQLVQQRDIKYRNKRYHPSVFQIRYRGYKGVLTLDPSIGPKIFVQFRESMRKFKDATDLSFSIVDYSRVRLD